MVPNLKFKITLILAIMILAGYTLYTKGLTLGLDLSGGSTLRYQLPEPKDLGNRTMAQVLEETLSVFRKRIQGYGLKEIPIRGQGENEITIELPGMSQAQVQNIQNIIESQGQLEWILLAETEPGAEGTTVPVNVEEEQKKLIDHLKNLEQTEGGWDLRSDLSSLSFERTIDGKKLFYRWLPNSTDSLEKRNIPVPTQNNGRLESLLPGIDQRPAEIRTYFELSRKYEDPKWQFSGKDLASVYPAFDEMRNPAVGFEFKPDREADFAEFTRAHVDYRMAIVLDGRINSAPVIQSEINGPGIISGPPPTGFTRIEQTSLLTVLRSGSLDVKPKLLSLITIGPTLGENSIRRGEIAAYLGGGAVVVFMVCYYFLAGVIASAALVVNLVLLMGIMSFLDATMTLPGIAGIVLTLGMAVDANILIYERIREEKDKGKTLVQAVKNGFERAFVTIVDSNLTTFITGFILFKVGTGPVQGFAATLMIGIITSLFTALVVSKVIFAFLLEEGWMKKVNMLRLLHSPNVNFLRVTRIAVTCSTLGVLASLAAFLLTGSGKYGLDFTGGFNVHLKTLPQTTQAEVQTRLGAVYPNVQVVTIQPGVEGMDRYRHFDVKIKSAKTMAQGDTDENYLARIKEALAGVIVQDPITDVSLKPDKTRGVANAEFTLNFEVPANQEVLRKALSDVIRVDDIRPVEGPDSLRVKGAYTQTAGITPEEFMAKLSAAFAVAKEQGVSLGLQDPFPLTGFIGPTVGQRLRDRAIIAILLSLIAIVAYVRVRFKEYKYGIAAAIPLVHDVMITLGAVMLGYLTGWIDVEIDLPMIAAFLTIIGYSLNDTIVIFDRVRENLPRVNLPFPDLLNQSINQTLSRTILTSGTVVLVVIVLFVLNYGQRNVMEGFAFAMLVGVVAGTYSTIYIACPILLWIHNREERAKALTASAAASGNGNKTGPSAAA